MKRSKFTDSQTMETLKWVDTGFAAPEACHELDISAAIFCKWRIKYDSTVTIHDGSHEGA